MKKGFTLIELLVVVLIIGILSAVALPQYQKAVEKSHAAEILSNVNVLSKEAEKYFLSGRTDLITMPDLNIELSGGGQYDPNHKSTYYTKNAMYSFYCGHGHCFLYAFRKNCFRGNELDTDNCDESHNWDILRIWKNGQIVFNTCYTKLTSTGRTICKGLESQGFEYRDEK